MRQEYDADEEATRADHWYDEQRIRQFEERTEREAVQFERESQATGI